MILNDLTVSWLKFCKEFDPSVTNVNFDAADSEDQLPRSTIFGCMALTFDVEEHAVSGTLQIGYSTYDDKNNVRLTEKVDALLGRLLPLSRVTVYDGQSGAVKGFMIIQSPVRVLPVVSGETRPLQFLAISFSTDQMYSTPGN